MATGLQAQDKPNIIYIMADDMGNADMSRNGTRYDTPCLDSMANEGAYFDRFYSYPGCTPTRSALMTGRYPLRQALWQVVIGRYDNYCLPEEENKFMLPRLIKEAGYQTALIGKWHLGHMYPECLPHTKGFDYYYGTSYGLIDYYDWEFEGADDVRENGIYQPTDGTYFTDKIAEKCEEYLDDWANCSSSPFFLFVPMLAPHVGPNGVGCNRLDIPTDSLPNAPSGLTTCQKRYWVMMKQMDYAISRIRAKVKDLGIENNTIIIFTSDNGADVDYAGDNSPYKGEKGDLTEGGINVPALWYHPGTVGSRTVTTPVQVEDFHPTLLKIAGRDISDIEQDLDGTDIYPLVLGNSIPSRMFLKQYQPTNNATTRTYAVIDGDWKFCNLCYSGEALYNITNDPDESNNVRTSNLSRATSMKNFADSFSGATQNRSNNNATSPPSGWQTIDVWAVPETFYDPNYFYYRNPKN